MVVDDDNENNENVVNRFIVSPKNQTNNGNIENFHQNINQNFGQNFSQNGDKNSGHCHHNGNESSQVNNHISTISSPDNFGVSTINGTCSNERSTSQKHFQFSPERNMKCENENENEYENGGRNENNIKNNGEYENDNVNDDEDDVVSNGNGNGHKYLEHTEDHDFRNKRAAHYNEYKLGTCVQISPPPFIFLSNAIFLIIFQRCPYVFSVH